MQFLFKLALRFGCPVQQLQKNISSKELTQWMAFDQISPIGDDRDEQLHGILCALLFNINRGKNNAKKPADFMPNIDRQAVKAIENQQLSQQLIAAFKGES